MAQMTATKPDLVPRCDIHADRGMVARSATAIDRSGGPSHTATVWFCHTEGCGRAFHSGAGYYDASSTARSSGMPLCRRHGESLIVQPRVEGFEYICPIVGCHEAQPWQAPKAVTKGE